MKKNKIYLFTIVFILFVVALAIKGFIFYRSGTRIAIIHPVPTPINTIPDAILNTGHRVPEYTPRVETPLYEYYKPTYTTDGKIDTKDWTGYVDDESRYSVQAPKGRAELGPTMDSDKIFLYTATNKNDIFVINAMVKKPGSNLQNWIDFYITANSDKILNKNFISLGEEKALQFETEKYPTQWSNLVLYKGATYHNSENATSSEEGGNFMQGSRHYIIDAGDKYLHLQYNMTDNKERNDVYNAIIESLRIFPPQKQ